MSCHEISYLVDYKGKIVMSNGDILKRSNNASIHHGIMKDFFNMSIKSMSSKHRNGSGFTMTHLEFK